MHPRDISRVVHEANQAIQVINGDPVNGEWDDLNDELKFSVYDGVKAALAGAGPKELHEQWVQERKGAGWTYGRYKDPRKKLHPQLVSYEELPKEQRIKDALFAAIVSALKD